MTGSISDSLSRLFNDRRRIAFGVAVLAFIGWFGLLISPGAPLPTEANMMGLRWGVIGLGIWGVLEYLRFRRSAE